MPLTTVTAADVMHDDPTTIGAGMLARPALDLILASPYRCVIVVDDERHPIGIVTDGDIIRVLLSDELPSGQHLRWLLASTDAVLQYVRDAGQAAERRTANLMSAPPVCVEPHDTLQRVAELFLEHDFKQLPVVSNGVLVGLVLRHDVVTVIVRQHDEAERALNSS